MIIGIYGKNLKFDSINEEILIISGNFEKIEYNEVKNV